MRQITFNKIDSLGRSEPLSGDGDAGLLLYANSYYEPEDIYPYLHHYYPSWCYVLLALAILFIIYLWLRPLPPAVDPKKIAMDVDAALTAYERELNSIGAGPAAIAVVEARRRALSKIS